jgi:hypothetical protein
LDRKRSDGPATDSEDFRQIGDCLRTTFDPPDPGSREDELTPLLLHLSQDPKPNAPTPKVRPKAKAEPRSPKRKSWLRRKTPE